MLLSQNFLTNSDIARRIVRSSGVGPDDLVLEVGPGDGMLTRHLLEVVDRVRAYEKDRGYAERLRARYADDHRIRLFHRDFRTLPAPDEPFAVVANVPFAVTTDIVRWCLSARKLTSATLLTQREFACKHSGAYGRWSKLAVTHWPTVAIGLGVRIGREHFHPVPKVDAALLHLRRRDRPLLPASALADYRALVELGYSGVGGSLAASLRRELPTRRVARACLIAHVAGDLPVGFVRPEQWLTLYRELRR
ncbi:23S ribosomal RNA methyltransferase Erm [Nocardia callitridis]|uniref:23S rRNA (Adenine(2058)-N(6))-methyltransferase Erm(O) n=1 Tax=Nocardia callitridis TaxID=648753 RepID=A0ABP9K6L6_9NOCA